jgi:PAS domain S-box-containing protein
VNEVNIRDIIERKGAEEALKRSEEKYRWIFTSIDEGFCIVELLFDDEGKPFDHVILEANPAFTVNSGIENPEGKRASELAPGIEQFWNDVYAKVIKTGESMRFEQRSDALNRWFNVLVSRIGDETDRTVAVIFKDITKRKQAEDRSLAAVAKFEAVFNQSGIFAGIMDLEGNLREVNDLAVNWCGYTREEVLDRPFWEAPWWRGSEEMKARIRAGTHQAASGIVCRETLHYWLADGSERIVDFVMHPIRDEAGVVRFLHPTGIDITERIQAEEKLRESEERLASELAATSRLHALSSRLLSAKNLTAALSDVLENAIVTCGADFGNIQLFNQQTESLEIVVHRGFQQEFLDYFRVVRMDEGSSCAQAMLSGERISIEDVELDPTFEPLRPIAAVAGYRAVQSTPLKTHNGLILGMLSTHFRKPHRVSGRDERLLDLYARHAADLIERLRFEQALQETDRLKDEFLATASHELRTPLTAIVGWTRMVRTGKLDEATAARALETIERNANAQTKLIEDLLDISRIITGKLLLDTQPVEVTPIVSNAVNTVRPAAEAKNIRIETSIDAQTGSVLADASRLQQVVWNLLSNAVKFTPREGRVEVNIQRTDSQVEISVSDTGEGIEPEFLPYVFDRFRQADGSKSRVHGGLGLGLAIVRQLVEMHGGTVTARSDGRGRGATFIVRLPQLGLYE